MFKIQDIKWTQLTDQDIESLKKVLNGLDRQELLNILEDASPEQRLILFRLLNKDMALKLFESFDATSQEHLLSTFSDEKAKEFIEKLMADDRTRLLEELPATVANKLIRQLSDKERGDVSLVMGYGPNTAGRIMIPDYIRITKNMTVQMALEHIEKIATKNHLVDVIYVTNEKKHLEGAISLRELLISNEDELIKNVMSTDLIYAYTDTDKKEVSELLRDYNFTAIPIVDSEERLVGLVRAESAIHFIEDEAHKEVLSKAGFANVHQEETDRSDVVIYGSTLAIWKVRLPFLLLTLFGGMVAGTIVAGFEDELASLALVAMFMPVVMDMGGNAGTQSTTIFCRGLLLGQIDLRVFSKHLIKETMAGFSMGFISGIIASIATYIWKGDIMVSISLLLSLTITMTLATFLGFIIPYILLKLKLDQAAGSDPIITTIKDITGLLIYFTIISVLLK